MAWIILEGADKVGKSTVAKHYESKGFQVIHFSAPPKKYYAPGYAGPSYVDDLVERLVPLSGKDVLFDRSWYGELIWSKVYNRPCLINEDDLELLSELEQQNDTRKILLHDPDVEAHWKRCVENNEPVNRQQFLLVNQLFEGLCKQRAFERLDYKSLLSEGRGDTNKPSNSSNDAVVGHSEPTVPPRQDGDTSSETSKLERVLSMTPEQKRLAEANAINDVLSRPIVKHKGDHFQSIEAKIRAFLNDELAVLLGTKQEVEVASLSKDEILFIKTLVSKAGVKR